MSRNEKTPDEIAALRGEVQSLRQYKALYENLSSIVPQGVATMDMKGFATWVNDTYCEITGYDKSEIIGKHFTRLASLRARDIPRLLRAFSRIVTGKQDTPIEFSYRRKDGSLGWGEAIAKVVNDGRRNVCIQVFVSDISERKRAHQTIEESEERYRILVEQSPFGVIVVNAKGTILDANPKACEIAGIEKPSLIGTSGMELVKPSSPRTFARLFRSVAMKGRVDNEVAESMNGRAVRFSVRVLQHEPFRLFCILEDITEKQLLEDQLRQAQKLDAVGTLAGGVAHELNNVLCGIMAISSLLTTDPTIGADAQRDISEILETCRRGRDLTHNLLGFARRGQYRKVRVNLNRTVEEVVEILKRTISRTIEIETSLERDLWEVEGDPAQLSHVVLNLCLNSVEAMEGKGTLTIETSTFTGENAADVTPLPVSDFVVMLNVRDSGPGMNDEVRERAFEPFYTTKPEGQGTGLGLSMVYGTIKNHGGEVAIKSELSEGTTVSILLPALGQAVLQDSKKPSGVPPLGARAGTLLLIDDEDLILRANKRILEGLGYSVLTAGNGREAIAVYGERLGEIDLVILDMIMPVLDGSDTFEMMRSIDPDIKILLCSGHTREGDADELLRRGAIGYVQKPFDIETIASAVSSALSPPV